MDIIVPEEKISNVISADICVIGGSCTGVFAAVRAARLGADVILVEKANRFGGVATCGLVGMWHTLFDMKGQRQIIGGITYEMMERLKKRNAVSPNFRDPANSRIHGVRFNSEELTLELDELVLEQKKIRFFLNTGFSRAISSNGRIDAVIAEN